MPYTVTRQQIVNAATELVGTRFRHQGRDAATGVDCVGLLVAIGRKIGFPEIIDIADYRRWPSSDVIRKTIGANCDEIAVEEVRRGDIYLMRIGGHQPRHAAVRISDEWDIPRGVQPMLTHAKGVGMRGRVVMEPVADWIKNCVCGFRVRGLVD